MKPLPFDPDCRLRIKLRNCEDKKIEAANALNRASDAEKEAQALAFRIAVQELGIAQAKITIAKLKVELGVLLSGERVMA